MEYNKTHYKEIVDIDTVDGVTRKACVQQWNENHQEQQIEVIMHTHLVDAAGKAVAKPFILNPYQTKITVTREGLTRSWPIPSDLAKFEAPLTSLDEVPSVKEIVTLAHAHNLFD
jgi:hypothetical protein